MLIIYANKGFVIGVKKYKYLANCMLPRNTILLKYFCFIGVPVAADLKNTPCAPNDYLVLDCNRCYCNMERTGYLCTVNVCPVIQTTPVITSIGVGTEGVSQDSRIKIGSAEESRLLNALTTTRATVQIEESPNSNSRNIIEHQSKSLITNGDSSTSTLNKLDTNENVTNRIHENSNTT